MAILPEVSTCNSRKLENELNTTWLLLLMDLRAKKACKTESGSRGSLTDNKILQFNLGYENLFSMWHFQQHAMQYPFIENHIPGTNHSY